MQSIGSLKAAEKHISAKIFKENLHTSVKILQICMDLQDSVQRSLQNPAEKFQSIPTQRCSCANPTDSQRSKTWDCYYSFPFRGQREVHAAVEERGECHGRAGCHQLPSTQKRLLQRPVLPRLQPATHQRPVSGHSATRRVFGGKANNINMQFTSPLFSSLLKYRN